MSISLSKFASLSLSCAENGNECILHMYTFGYTRTTTLWLKSTLLQIWFKMWRTKFFISQLWNYNTFLSFFHLEHLWNISSKSVNIDQGQIQSCFKWKTRKNLSGFFLIPKIWQILKCFSTSWLRKLHDNIVISFATWTILQFTCRILKTIWSNAVANFWPITIVKN